MLASLTVFVNLINLPLSPEHWNWDTWKGAGGGADHEEEGGDGGEYEAQDPNCEDPDFIVSTSCLTMPYLKYILSK